MEQKKDSTFCAVCQRPNRNYYTYICQKTSLLCCTACRIFYVDSVRSNIYQSYKCGEKQQCDLAVKRGKYLCRYCKFQKCCEVGMTEDSIKPTRKFALSEIQKIQIIQTNYQESSNEVNLDFNIMASIISGHKHNWIPVKHSKEVMIFIHHFPALVLKTLEKEESFQSLCRGDQILLFNNNAALFGMFILGNYLKASTGHDQLHVLFDSLNHTIGLKCQWYFGYSISSLN